MILANVNSKVMESMVTNEGTTLGVLSMNSPVLLVFLRHFGCTFCREALSDIARRRARIEGEGVKLVFVHMAGDEVAERYFERFGLKGATHISDPQCRYYAAFGLTKGTLTQLFGLQSWIRGFQAGVVDGHGAGPMLGDGFQMPGIFVVQNGEIKERFVHKLASDRPDYVGLIQCCTVD